MEKQRYCVVCCSETMQGKCKLFPDEDDSPLVWVCSVCNEELEMINQNQ